MVSDRARHPPHAHHAPRRRALAALCAAPLGGLLASLGACASEGPAVGAMPGQPQPWRTLLGGRAAVALPGVGLPTSPSLLPGTAGAGFVRFTSPGAVALRGQDLLVAELAGARLWRVDLTTETLVAIAAAPVSPEMSLALGPDLSAWVLDPRGRRLLRYARDGHLAQTLPLPLAVPTPVALALADGGTTALVADGASAQWFEQRGSVPRFVLAERAATPLVGSCDGLVALGDGRLLLLDRLNGLVHECTRDGRCTASLGRGELMQPVAVVGDRRGRPIVHDAQDGSLKRLSATRAAERWPAAQLGLLRIGGIACDGDLLAVTDPVSGRVALLTLPPGETA